MTITTVANTGNSVGGFAKLRIGLDGFPVIAQKSFVLNALLLTKCDDPACSGTGELTSTVDALGGNGLGNDISLLIRANGLPLISHRNAPSATVRLVNCNDVACAGGNDEVSVLGDNGQSIGGLKALSMALGADGLPVLAFVNATNGALRLAHCADDHCFVGAATFATLDDPGGELRNVVALIAPDNTPIVAYQNFATGQLKVVKCGTRGCL